MSQAHETVLQEPSFRGATAELRQVTSSLWRHVSIYDYDCPLGGDERAVFAISYIVDLWESPGEANGTSHEEEEA